MNSILKPVIACFIALIGVALLMAGVKTEVTKDTHDEFDYALRTATQDATACLIDDGYLFGREEEIQDFAINLDAASRQFVSSFHKNLGAVVPLSVVNDMNVAMCGVVGYRYVYAQYSTGNPTLPFSYCYTIGDKQYEFTLGDKVYVCDINITDPATGKMKETVKYINNAGALPEYNLPENFFSPDMTNSEFRDFIVMTRINEFLTVFYSDDANIIACNAGSGLQFNLGTSDYAVSDINPDEYGYIMTKMSAIIDGQGFFAIVDYNDSELDQMVRILSFGGSELIPRVGG